MLEIHEGKVVSTAIRWIAYGPHSVLMSCEGYKVNIICFNTKSHDDSKTIHNSYVMFIAEIM